MLLEIPLFITSDTFFFFHPQHMVGISTGIGTNQKNRFVLLFCASRFYEVQIPYRYCVKWNLTQEGIWTWEGARTTS
jgi:hypothetical protein